MEERQRVAIIRDLQERAEAQRAANEAWALKVEESQSVADGLAKKASLRGCKDCLSADPPCARVRRSRGGGGRPGFSPDQSGGLGGNSTFSFRIP